MTVSLFAGISLNCRKQEQDVFSIFHSNFFRSGGAYDTFHTVSGPERYISALYDRNSVLLSDHAGGRRGFFRVLLYGQQQGEPVAGFRI